VTLQHASLETRRADVDGEVAFWALLGFAVTEPPPALREIATWVSRRGTQIHLLYADDPVTPPRGHVAVVVDDYEATAAGLEDAGFAVEPRAPHWHTPRAFVRSPAGHRVEIMATPAPG
jgi:catechol 2,3-dioxygenase-like lactoylglutathione lyase family enzyme